MFTLQTSLLRLPVPSSCDYLLVGSTESKLVDGFAAAELQSFVLGNLEIAANLLLMFLADQRTHPRPTVSRITHRDLSVPSTSFITNHFSG